MAPLVVTLLSAVTDRTGAMRTEALKVAVKLNPPGMQRTPLQIVPVKTRSAGHTRTWIAPPGTGPARRKAEAVEAGTP